VEGGIAFVLTARTPDGIHEVIYEAATTPVAQEILQLAGPDE
jgi:hypothetical protein